ncbi:MAG TPA: L,D-transpeptidase [Nitrospira sp.]|nr:L,D-transpeptidase [Nitrospira sp.]
MKRVAISLWSSLIGLLLLTLAQSSGLPVTDASMTQPVPIDPVALRALQVRYKSLVKRLANQMPTQRYILVDTARNRLFIKRRDQVMLDALASTGSGTILDKPGGATGQWIFDTPRGEFSIQSKLINPVWVKPDWAFIEEGLTVPASQADRIEPGVLGEYALGFGKGYFIHGTLYTRLLGKNVTHGCIRLSDDDLKSVYRLAQVGTPIMIF